MTRSRNTVSTAIVASALGAACPADFSPPADATSNSGSDGGTSASTGGASDSDDPGSSHSGGGTSTTSASTGGASDSGSGTTRGIATGGTDSGTTDGGTTGSATLGSTSAITATGGTTSGTGFTTGGLSGTGTASSTSGTTSGTGDSGTTGGAMCPETTHACLPAVPSGWTGPLAVHTGAAAELPPSCQGGYTQPLFDLNGDLQAPPVTCDCECGDPVGTTCQPITMDRYANVSCSATPTGTQIGGSFAERQCKMVADYTMVFTGTFHKMSDGGVSTPGACTEMPTEIIPMASWSSALRGCGTTTPDAGGCGMDETCAPVVPDAFADTCIAQTGDVQCPVSPYSERAVYYGDFADTRSCSECTCGTPTGTCGGTVDFRNGECDGPAFEQVGLGDCSGNLSGNYLFATYVPSDGACAASNSVVQGSAQGTQPATFCCLP